MRGALKSISLTCFLALGLTLGVGGPVRAGLPVVVSADQEAEAVNPGRARHRWRPEEIARANADFRATMDRVFGPGRWRQTSGYRTIAQENALRRAGAGTVAPGRLSRHSIGNPEAPGAYDAVVAGMPLSAAAARLKQSADGAFARIVAEAAHGREGPHLHVELISAELPSRGR